MALSQSSLFLVPVDKGNEDSGDEIVFTGSISHEHCVFLSYDIFPVDSMIELDFEMSLSIIVKGFLIW